MPAGRERPATLHVDSKPVLGTETTLPAPLAGPRMRRGRRQQPGPPPLPACAAARLRWRVVLLDRRRVDPEFGAQRGRTQWGLAVGWASRISSTVSRRRSATRCAHRSTRSSSTSRSPPVSCSSAAPRAVAISAGTRSASRSISSTVFFSSWYRTSSDRGARDRHLRSRLRLARGPLAQAGRSAGSRVGRLAPPDLARVLGK